MNTFPIRYGRLGGAATGTATAVVTTGRAYVITEAITSGEATSIGSPSTAVGTRFVATGTATLGAPGRVQTLGAGNPVMAAYNMLRYVELDIGGQIIDRLYGEWMYIWTLLTHSTDKFTSLTAGLYDTGVASNGCGIAGRPILGNSYHIPLPFYFARNPSAAIPLIALQYHEVKINIMWNKTEIVQINNSGGAAKSNGPRQANLICDYVYLDVEERRRMAQESHEYLIEQTQYNEDKGVTGAMIRCDLTFNHPVKELVWVVQNSRFGSCTLGNAQGGGNDFDPLNFNENAMYSANLQLNGQDRMQTLYSPYFNAVQVYQHHTGGSNLPTATGGNGGIYCYSFALKPEEHQPSGTCNFSRIDSATLVMTLNGSTAVSLADDKNYDVRVYALNYNILRVMSGMGGLAYSN